MLEASSFSEKAVAEHNRLYSDALKASMNEIPLADRPHMPAPGWLTAYKLRRAIALFKRALQINPQNWNAMWFIGKLEQRLRNWEEAFDYHVRAYQINPTQPDVAREASLSAMALGRTDEAIRIAHAASSLQPSNAGLSANLALAYLLAGRVSDAHVAIDQALSQDPNDAVSETLEAMIRHFESYGRVPPNTTSKLENYWQQHLKAIRRSSVL